MAGKQGQRGFGYLRRLPSKRWQASYIGPDLNRHNAPETFTTKTDAEAWLSAERRLSEQPETWLSPAERRTIATAKAETRPLTFGEYAETFLAERHVKGRPLTAVTRDNYRTSLRLYILPTFGDMPLTAITREAVKRWYDTCAPGRQTTRARAYGVLRVILNDALDNDLIPTNPCKIRGGGRVERESVTRVATVEELSVIADHMPDHRRLMVQLAGWCGLRYGEVAELRRRDIDTRAGMIHIRRSVVFTRSGQGAVVKTPKSDAGIRDVPIPPHLLTDVREHLLKHAAKGKDGLLFPGQHGAQISSGSIRDAFHTARTAAGRPDLRFHDLRHTALTIAAQEGATTAELMALAGHSDYTSVMRYQHATQDRMRSLAARISDRAGIGS